MMQSICIVRLSALGDALMLVPLVRTLQAAYPQVKLTWVISEPAYSLVAGLEGVEFIVIEKPKNVRDYWRFARLIRRHRYDVLLAAQASFRANLLYPLIRATRKIGFDSLRAKDGHGLFINETISPGKDHTLESFLKFADVLAIKSKKISWDIPIPAVDDEWARAHLPDAKGPLLLVNAAASKPERSWPVDRYITVIQHAINHWHAEVVLIGGPGAFDHKLAAEILSAVNVKSLVGKTKPKQLLALIKRADLLLCPDTGPSHMAGAVATPVIALHAVTSANVSGAYPFRELAVDYYPQAVATVLKTSTAQNIWGTHAHGMETMKLIPVDAVIQRIDQVLAELGFNNSQ